MIIGLDFDGTCVTHEFPKIGKDIGAVPVLKELVQNGHKIVLNTMRCDSEKKTLTEALLWFKENDIPLYGANCTPGQKSWTKSPKVYAHLYIDDSALGIPLILNKSISDRPYVDWPMVRKYLITCGWIK